VASVLPQFASAWVKDWRLYLSDSGEFVQSLERGLAVIRAFTRERPQLTLTDAAAATGLTRATARRFLMTLASLGYATTDGKQWRLTARVLDLGHSYLASLGLPEIVVDHLDRVAQAVHESASAAVLDGDDIVYVARVESRKIMRVQITVGTRFPAYVTSMGRVLLADLDSSAAERILRASDRRSLTTHTTTEVSELMFELSRVREAGFSLVDQELEMGLRSLAVPVRDVSGRVVAAINVSTTAAGAARETVESVLPALLIAQSDIEGELASLVREYRKE
jgi:IclR family pca regulon transcriptional regulator